MKKQTKTIYSVFFAFLIFVMIHNFLSFFWKVEEAIFFLLSLAALVLFLILVIVNLIRFFSSKMPEDIWKLGFLGITGFLAFIFWPPKAAFLFFFLFFFFFLAKIKKQSLEKEDYSSGSLN
jgi:hypothetical protein